MKRPSAIVTLGGRSLRASEAALASLRVRLARDSHDAVELVLDPRTKLARAKPGDELSVRLGFVGEEADVWSGDVSGVERTARALLVTGLARTARLSRERKAQTYVAQPLADVVRDLAGSIAVDRVDGSTELSYFAVDQRRSVWGHLLDLAQLFGSELSCSASGGLRFLPIEPLPSATRFRHGAELLAWRVGPSEPPAATAFVAHGSASTSGSAKWHWLEPEPSTGEGRNRVIGAFHSDAAAEAASRGAQGRARRAAVRAELTLVGQAQLRVGDVFSLAELPQGDPGPLRALAVTHHLDGVRGFWSSVVAEAST